MCAPAGDIGVRRSALSRSEMVKYHDPVGFVRWVRYPELGFANGTRGRNLFPGGRGREIETPNLHLRTGRCLCWGGHGPTGKQRRQENFCQLIIQNIFTANNTPILNIFFSLRKSHFT